MILINQMLLLFTLIMVPIQKYRDVNDRRDNGAAHEIEEK